MFFDQQIVLLEKDSKTKEEAFRLLADELIKTHCVNDQFYQNIVQREETFPTGLKINGIGVAIPHTDSKFVLRSQVAFMSLASPLSFIEMGSQEKKIDVSLLFMLALKEPHEQLGMLQNLISMFQTPGVLEALSSVTTKEAYLSIIEKNGLQ